MSFNIVLVEPEIPQNTGNIARTCAATGTKLHLIKPLGFEIDDAKLKRAGLDYWHLLGVEYYEGLGDFFDKVNPKRIFLASTKSAKSYTEAEFRDGDYIFFGKETKGLPEDFILQNLSSAIRIPMIDEARSLNLSNSVAVILYEALRQTGFENLKDAGKFSENLTKNM